MGRTGLSTLLVEAKKQWVAQLADAVTPFVMTSFASVYAATGPGKKFTEKLRQIPKWNTSVIRKMTRPIELRHPSFGGLKKAAFATYVKIFLSVRIHSEKPTLQLEVPSNDTFVHQIYVQMAREFLENPKLVTLRSHRRQRDLVENAIEASIRALLPMNDIVKAFAGGAVETETNVVKPAKMDDDDIESSSDDEDPDPPPRNPTPAPSPAPSMVSPAPAPPMASPAPPMASPAPAMASPAPPMASPPMASPPMASPQNPSPARVSPSPALGAFVSRRPPTTSPDLFSDADDL